MVRSLIPALVTALLALACTGPAVSTPSQPAKPAGTGCGPWQGTTAALNADASAHGVQLIQRQHSGEIWSLIGLAEGMVASGGDDNTVRVWDLDTRTLIRVIRERQLIGRGRGGRGVIVEGYETTAPHWSEVAVRDGRVLAPAAATPTTARDAGASAPRPLARVAGNGSPRWIGVDMARRELVWFDDKRALRGRLASPVEPSSHDLQLVDRITARANFWAQGTTLVAELDPDGYGPQPSSIVSWRSERSAPRRVVPLPSQRVHLLGLDRAGRHLLLHVVPDDGPTELRLLELEAGANSAERGANDAIGKRLLELGSPSFRTKMATAPRGDRIAVVNGKELIVYDLARRSVAWRAKAADRVIAASKPRPGPWHEQADSEQHLFEDVAFSGDGRFIAVRTRVKVSAFHAASGRYRGDLGASPHAIAAAPRFASSDEILVAAAGHLQKWNVAHGTLEATGDVPPYFDRAECTNANLVRMCSVGYADAYLPFADGDVLRVRAVAQVYGTVLPQDPARGLTECRRQETDPTTGEETTARGSPIMFERTTGLEPLEPLRSANVPPLRQWPPESGSRRVLCSPIRLDYFHIGQQIDASRGRLVGELVGKTDGAIYDLSAAAAIELEGEAQPESWEAGGKLVAGRLRHDVAKYGAALWTDRGKLLWQAPDLADRLLAVRSDGARAAYARWSAERAPVELVFVNLSDGAEIARVTVPEPCHASIHGRASYWPADSDELLCGTASGALLRIHDGQVRRVDLATGDEIRALVPSPDGTRLISWSLDGLLRVWERKELALLASLIEFDDGEWLAFTPAGTYGGTPEAAERVAWAFDDHSAGRTAAGGGRPEVFRFEQFAASFRRPELVKQRLSGRPLRTPPLRRPPTARIVESTARRDGTARLRIQAASPSRVDWVRVYVEGRELGAHAVCAAAGEVDMEVPLVSGTNRLTAIAFDAEGLTSNPTQVDLRSTTGARPDLYLVTVGVSRYPHLPAALQLEAADDDARALVAAFRRQTGKGKIYGRLHATALIDQAATVTAIDGAVEQLARMKPTDVAIIFLAGHGVKPAADEEMVFLTSGTRSTKARDVRRAGYGWHRMAQRLAALSGRVLVLLDACHSGHVSRELVVPNETMARSLAAGGRAGAVVFAASKGRQVSFEASGTRALTLAEEDPALEQVQRMGEPHGLFTAAVLASLDNVETDRNSDGVVHLSELLGAVSGRVARASGGRQTPWVARRELFGDFVISRPPPR